MPSAARLGPVLPTMSNRAFDTTKLGSGYGFESHPEKMVEMPPAWALVVALAFLLVAMAFWVGQSVGRNAHKNIVNMTSTYRFTSPLICLHQRHEHRVVQKSSTRPYYPTDHTVNQKHYLAGWTNGLPRKRLRRGQQLSNLVPRL